MTDIDLQEARKSTDPAIIPVLCNVIDRLIAQLDGMQRQRDEAKRLVFEAQQIMRRWGFLCPNERESWDLRVEECLSRRSHHDQTSNIEGNK
jgi:hypothetical protein